MSLYSANDSQHLTITAPAATKVPSGPYTVGVLYRNVAFQSCGIWKGYQPDNYSQVSLYFDGDVWANFAQWDGNLSISAATWRWIVISKGTAVETPRVHVADYTASGTLAWTHANTTSTYGANNDLNRFSIGDQFGDGFRGDLACMTAFTTALSDTQVASTFARSSATILSAGPKFFVHWPFSAGLTGPFVDLAGGGVETIRTGTWAVSADPTNYSFSLGRSGKPKVWNGSSWVVRSTKTWNGSAWVAHSMKGHNGTDFIASK